MIAIFDYGAGNLQSVQNTLAEIGATYTLTRDSDGLRAASKIILPGVGHFGQMMRALDALRVRETLLERIAAGVPFLGICLGLQALLTESEEAAEAPGLGLYPGTVRRFPLDARVLYGRSNHHKIEAIIKCFARAMKFACSTDRRLRGQLPSTKGLL